MIKIYPAAKGRSRSSVILLITLLHSCYVLSQEAYPDSSGIISFADRFIVKANVSTQTDTYRYSSLQSANRLELTPNTSLRLLVSLDYEFIGASLGFAPSFLSNNADEDKKGTSSFSDYRFRFFFGQWVQGVQYRRVKGYYVENTGDFLPGWQEGRDPYIQFPDLRNVTLGMSTAYVFNPRFSYRNVLYQTEWQKASAGSFIPALLYDYTVFSFSEMDVTSRERNWNLRLSPGYYYTLVLHENWFISASANPALGFRFVGSQSTEEGVVSREQYGLLTTSLGNGLQLGYSSNRIIFGFTLNNDINWYHQREEASVQNDQLYAVLYFGYRFEAPGFARKTMDWLYGR